MSRFEKRRRAQTARAVVGVDAGKYKHVLVVRPHNAPDSRPFTFDVSRDGFDAAAQFIRAAAPDATPEATIVGIEFAGIYGFTLAYYLADLGYQVVTVLPAHSKRWKEVVHNQRLKTDAKDAMVITDLVAQGNFVAFAFLDPAYADLRSLVSARERLSVERRALIARIKSVLEGVWPEFERRFKNFGKRTLIALLEAYPFRKSPVHQRQDLGMWGQQNTLKRQKAGFRPRMARPDREPAQSPMKACRGPSSRRRLRGRVRIELRGARVRLGAI